LIITAAVDSELLQQPPTRRRLTRVVDLRGRGADRFHVPLGQRRHAAKPTHQIERHALAAQQVMGVPFELADDRSRF
jgi:hypothetical protein